MELFLITNVVLPAGTVISIGSHTLSLTDTCTSPPAAGAAAAPLAAGASAGLAACSPHAANNKAVLTAKAKGDRVDNFMFLPQF